MTTLREAAQQALEALEATHYDVGSAEKQRLQTMDAITALRKALAHQEQEKTRVFAFSRAIEQALRSKNQ